MTVGAAIAKAAQIAVATMPRPRRGGAGGGASSSATVMLILHPRVNGAPPPVSLPARIVRVQRRPPRRRSLVRCVADRLAPGGRQAIIRRARGAREPRHPKV